MIDKNRAIKDARKVFDTFLTIQKKVEQTGPYPPLDNYKEYIGIWAESRYLKGRNLYSARAGNIKTDVEFIIRYRKDLDESMRIVANGKTYEIEGILPLDNNRLYLSIRAYEIKTNV